ncbi:triphosphoribosyl-dephospho-CoA synthase [Halanaeroarchaeum sulfurireducens]|uniref:Triphosphoribosyl-dephospho-CoA protein n=1 Tax=Halanaeroarchaeum sulfurireducens TaxID=1604004 RepID=A0A0F7PDC1_9EURY|nr:triphosphoribosyl-dephospho-CoA synthase [Halanaeroarchaeum sulfurireducens]AKH98165.1 triphosphoribosyl-dephospho-CoA protein [Halanaeroarchaeum sulfurireducens]ALG82559.1 triphosphoribosyl-dephospho-CoA protein [Halanaeroarchaeum sulfurireducens]
MSQRTPAQAAELALLLEVAGTPKPGNVDRHRDLDDLRFEHFLAGAVGARPGLAAAAAGDPVGESFERAVAGMADQRGGNTQFGALLLLVPLVAATEGDGPPSRDAVERVLAETTVADAAAFYRAFDHVAVLVGEPPADAPDLDVRRGSDAVPDVEARGISLAAVMERSAPKDGVAAEWSNGFERTFASADRLAAGDGPILDRTADTFLALLADEPDSLVATKHGDDVARSVSERASTLLDAPRADVEAFADDLVKGGINPGTTADVTAAALYVALQRGVPV